MNQHEKIERQMSLVEYAFYILKYVAEEERKITNTENIDSYYQEALNCLEMKINNLKEQFGVEE